MAGLNRVSGYMSRSGRADHMVLHFFLRNLYVDVYSGCINFHPISSEHGFPSLTCSLAIVRLLNDNVLPGLRWLLRVVFLAFP